MAESRDININVKVNGEEKLSKLGEKAIKVGDDISKVGAGIAGAFAVAAGTVGAFGDALGYSQEEIDKAQKAATSYIGILAGIKPLFEGIVSGVRLAGQAFKVLSAVIAANPIGAIITAIGIAIALVVTYFDEIKAAGVAAANFIVENWKIVATVIFPIPGLILLISDAFFGAEASAEDMGDAMVKALNEAKVASAKAAGSQLADIQSILTARLDTLAKERTALDEKYSFERAQALLLGEDLKGLDKEYLESKLENIRQQLEAEQILFNEKIRFADNLLAYNDNEFNQGISAATKKQATEKQDALVKEFESTKSTLDAIVQKEKDAGQKIVDDRKARNDKIFELDEKLREEELAAQLRLIAQADADYKKYLEDRRKFNEEIIVINTDILDATVAKNSQAALDEYQSAYDLYLKKKGLSEQEFNDRRELEDQKIGLVQGGFDVISSLTELFGSKSEAAAKKAFAVNKAVGIAQAAIQTYQSAQGAYLSQLTIPSPDAPIRAAVAAGIATAAGIANIAKIAATKFQGSAPTSSSVSSSSIGGSSSASPATPSTQLFGTAGGFNQGGTQNQGQNMVVQAVVSESDITQTVNRVANYRLASEL